MKVEEQNKAISLRQKGLSYKEILNEIPVSKASLSRWLKDISLSNEQLSRIYQKNLVTRRRFVEYNQLKRERSLEEKSKIALDAQYEIVKEIPSEQGLKLVGIALYWAEGYTAPKGTSVMFTNSDPKMIKIMMWWFREVCDVPEAKFRLRLQLHDGTQVNEQTRYWSEVTNIPQGQFIRPYLKVSSSSQRKVGKRLTHGVLQIRVNDTKLLCKIRGWISGLSLAPSSSLV